MENDREIPEYPLAFLRETHSPLPMPCSGQEKAGMEKVAASRMGICKVGFLSVGIGTN